MYTAKNFENLLGMTGFSDALLKNHFTLYEGYVKNINIILEKQKSELMSEKNSPISPEASELIRRLGWEYNGMKLHELYFENLAKRDSESSIALETNMNSKLGIQIKETFQNFDNFKNIFQQIGKIRGIGWVALVKNLENNNLFIIWIDEHNVGNLANSEIILIMDVFEHAFMIDYGLKRVDYITAFWENIHWKICEERFAQ